MHACMRLKVPHGACHTITLACTAPMFWFPIAQTPPLHQNAPLKSRYSSTNTAAAQNKTVTAKAFPAVAEELSTGPGLPPTCDPVAMRAQVWDARGTLGCGEGARPRPKSHRLIQTRPSKKRHNTK